MDAITKYGFVFGARHTKKQKFEFVEELKKDANSNGISMRTQVLKDKRNQRIHVHLDSAENKESKYTLVAAYDTPTKALRPNYMYYPFDTEANISENRKNLIFQGLIFLILIALGVCAIKSGLGVAGIKAILLYFLGIALIVFSIIIISGVPNRININRNSMACIIIMNCLSQIKAKGVLLDRNIEGLIGAEDYSRYQNDSDESSIPIFLDCIAVGNHFNIFSHGCIKEAQRLLEHLSDQNLDCSLRDVPKGHKYKKLYNQFIYIVVTPQKKSDVKVPRTASNRDKSINSKNIVDLEKSIISFIREGS